MLDVSIVMVNYYTSDLVEKAVSSIVSNSRGFSYEIIIVDNSCSKEEFQKLKDIQKNFKTVISNLIDSGENLGFGKANNLGEHVASGKYIFFINEDTLLINNAIYLMKVFLDCNPGVGVVGPNLFTKSFFPNHSYFLDEKSLKNEKKNDSFFVKIKRGLTKKRVDFNYSNVPIEIKGYICGAALMIKKELYEEIGGFDKDIFMYAEESLLCYKVIKTSNYSVFNVPIAKIIHFDGGTFNNKITINRAKALVDGNYIYYLKAYGRKEAHKYICYKRRYYKKMLFFSKLLHKKQTESFSNLFEATTNKIHEIKRGKLK